jgi:hypothetical protein
MESGVNPFVFAVGCPRSGTTLLQRMLDHHPALAVANDTHFIPRCLEKFAPGQLDAAGRGEAIPLSPGLVAEVSGYHRFHRLGLTDQQVQTAARGTETYSEFVGALYGRFARARGKSLGGEKTPDYVRRLPLLGGLFPRAKFVHIVRDGRDVALSVLDWAGEGKGPGRLDLWRTEPVATCALWWRWQVVAGRRDGLALGNDRYLEVRYDDLVSEGEREMRRVFEFLRLPYSASVLAYHEGRTRSDPEKSAKSRWLPPTAGLRDWRTQMKERDVALFETLAGDLLDEFAFERVAGEPATSIRSTAASATAWWDAFLDHRAAKARRRRTEARR